VGEVLEERGFLMCNVFRLVENFTTLQLFMPCPVMETLTALAWCIGAVVEQVFWNVGMGLIMYGELVS
jgi:hypothetical protein